MDLVCLIQLLSMFLFLFYNHKIAISWEAQDCNKAQLPNPFSFYYILVVLFGDCFHLIRLCVQSNIVTDDPGVLAGDWCLTPLTSPSTTQRNFRWLVVHLAKHLGANVQATNFLRV